MGFGPEIRRFYDVHVVADAEHEVIALERLAAGLVAEEPALAAEVVFGAKAVMAVEGPFSAGLLAAWAEGRTSLLAPLPAVRPPSAS
jgi:hypothetical protein